MTNYIYLERLSGQLEVESTVFSVFLVGTRIVYIQRYSLEVQDITNKISWKILIINRSFNGKLLLFFQNRIKFFPRPLRGFFPWPLREQERRGNFNRRRTPQNNNFKKPRWPAVTRCKDSVICLFKATLSAILFVTV